LQGSASRRILRRAIGYSAVRLVQAGYEQMQTAMDLNANVVCLLQMSLNILRGPDTALRDLCGIEVGR
jgi:hypothetical protein